MITVGSLRSEEQSFAKGCAYAVGYIIGLICIVAFGLVVLWAAIKVVRIAWG